MRNAEGACGNKSRVLAEQSRDTVYLRNLDGFFLRQLGQNRRHPTCQHRLARAGYTDHQDIMASLWRNLKRTFCLVLPLYVRKVIGKGIVFCVFDWFWRGGGQRFRSRQMAYQLRQILNRIDL